MNFRQALRPLLLCLLVLGAAGSLWSQSADDLLARAESRYRAGNYLLALDDYLGFAKAYSLSARASDVQYRIGVCQYRLGRDADAVATFRRMERRYTNTPYFDYIYLWAGLAQYRLALWEESIESLQTFEARVGAGADSALKARSTLTIGLAQLEVDLWEEAESSIQRFLTEHASDPQWTYASLRLVHLYLSTDRYQMALDQAEATPVEPAYEDLHAFYRAEALWGLGRAEEADYRGLLDSDPDISSVAFQRVFQMAEGNLGQMETLIQRAEQSLARRPDVLTDLWTRVGVESFRSGSTDLAEYFLGRVWRTDGAAPEAGLYLAEAQISAGHYDRAEPVLEEIRAGGTSYADRAALRLGDLELARGRYGEAAEQFGLYLRDFPQGERRSEATILLAYSRYRTGDLKGALELTESLAQNPEADLPSDLARLQAAILEGAGQTSRAADVLSPYAAEFPQDLQARLDLTRLLNAAGRHEEVVEEARLLLDARGSSSRNTAMALYLKGLSEISLKRYQEATVSLTGLSTERLESADLLSLEPQVLYYLGWAQFRMQAYEAATDPLFQLIDRYPDHPLREQAVYLAGWCLYSLRDFGTALPFFQELAGGTGEEARRAEFLVVKCLVNLGRLDQARSALERMTGGDDAFSDDVLFELGEVQARSGRIDSAASTWRGLSERYRSSPLAEEALFRRGDLYRKEERWEEAAEAFRLHRLRYPNGEQVDGSLYWGGLSVSETGHPSGAALLWGILIDEYPDSPFRPDALRRTAAILEDQGNNSGALELYAELVRLYPDEAGDAAEKADALRFLLLGLGRREAELTAAIQNQGGVSSSIGRDSMLELARLYIYDEQGKLGLAFDILRTLLEAGDDRAHFLMGEYYERSGDPVRAGAAFLDAAIAAGDDAEAAASALYRAAVAMNSAGREADVRAIFGRLESGFPASPWTDRARALLEGRR